LFRLFSGNGINPGTILKGGLPYAVRIFAELTILRFDGLFRMQSKKGESMNNKSLILALIGLGICAQANSASLSTTDGTTYNNITAERADPDGLYIEYTPAGGGLGVSKIKFSRLSPEQQKQFGYDPDKARDFEAKLARSMEDWRQEGIRSEQIAQAQRAARQARESQEEQFLHDRMMTIAESQQAQAAMPNATDDGENGWSPYGGGYGVFAMPPFGAGPNAKTVYAPAVHPLIIPRPNHSRSAR
jgi:hypothetical protein